MDGALIVPVFIFVLLVIQGAPLLHFVLLVMIIMLTEFAEEIGQTDPFAMRLEMGLNIFGALRLVAKNRDFEV
ncbi:MAG: hypothetical protein UX75_C0020G0012 [Candidatus Moranbacteria bacterium GW2011_GWE2_47_10]|nr:MAG: hypothetical protein UX75_C0020G0012 [Candidatus Moranbacteria bacterium GW2011_GWE2_47_10]